MNVGKWNDEQENKILASYFGLSNFDIEYNRDQTKIFRYYANNMLKRTIRMFEYKNLPETLSARALEKYLQGGGKCVVYDVPASQIASDRKPGIYCFPCSVGGELDTYYLPTRVTISNPYLSLSVDLDIENDKEAVLLWNDSLLNGLSDMFNLYCSELTDNVTTLHFQEVIARIEAILKADSEDQKKDGKDFFRDIENGKFGILMNGEFLDEMVKNRVEMFSSNAKMTIKDTLEARQFILAHWFIELGLNDNYNMKRESLNDGEIDANSDTLTPLIEDMLKTRKEGIARLNARYNLNIEVSLAPTWKRVIERAEMAHDKDKAEVETAENVAEGGAENATDGSAE